MSGPRRGHRPGTGLRTRLVLAVGTAVVLTVAVAFAIVYRQSRADTRSQLDDTLRIDSLQLAQALSVPSAATPAQVLATARAYAREQSYRDPAVLFFAIVPGPGGGVATAHPELFGAVDAGERESASDRHAETRDGRSLSRPRLGFSTRPGPDVGPLRIFQTRVRLPGGQVVDAGAAESTEGIDRAAENVLRSFALGGGLALVLAIAFAWLTGSRLSAPLRRAAEVAAQIDGGDLSPRMPLPRRPARELDVLLESFNHMLDRLDDAFAAQRDFVADASHELRTPLTVIRGQIELLAGAESADREELRRVERMVGAEIGRLTRLTDDLLLLARADRVDVLALEPIALPRFIGDLWDGLSLTAERDFALGPLDPLTILADPDRLAQALRNLAANAIAHTNAPDGLVRVSARASPDGRSVTIAVEDDGPGIPEDQRERVFERFHRTDPGRARRDGGTGLGLAIVLAVVEAHGGTVHAGERPGGGARLELVLPVRAAARPEPVPTGSPVA